MAVLGDVLARRDVAALKHLSTREARELQLALRERRLDRPPRGFRPRLAAGADVSIVRGRDRGHAAIVVVDLETMETVAEGTASVDVDFPYVPGLLSFRELPPLMEAWGTLTTLPDVLLFDAHGVAHPRRFGLASHGGVLLDVPSIGVAKSVLVGAHGPVGEVRGSTAPLVEGDEVVGMALRTRSAVRPVYVSVGHRVDLDTAVATALRASPRYRIPEPIRRAHRLSNALRTAVR